MKTNTIYRQLFFLAFTIILLISLIITFLSKPISQNEFKLTINNVEFLLQIANTPEKRAAGLMFKSIQEIKDGMLFIFPDSQVRTFWMKNTYAALDILFLDSSWQIINFVQNTKTNQILETYSSEKPAKYVLEFPAGTINKHKITLNSTVFPEYSISTLN